MADLTQHSVLRGTYRTAAGSESAAVSGLSTTDVHNQIAFDRPSPVKVGWTSYNNPFGIPPQPPSTGYGPGSLYIIFPTSSLLAGPNAYVQLWLNTNQTQPTGVGNWVMVSQMNAGLGGSSASGGGDGSGSGGGDGGSG